MENKEIMTPEQSLQVIANMVSNAKESFAKDSGFIWIMWGWIIAIASTAQFVMLQLDMGKWSALPWTLTIIGSIYTVVYSIKESKKVSTKTHVDEFMKYLWIAFGVSIFMIIGFCGEHSELIMPMSIVLYGLGTFVSGGALKFKPLMIGGILCWGIALVAYNVEIQYQLPLIALAVIVSYLIPGYMLKSQFKKS